MGRAWAFIKHEFREALPAMLFFFVGFNLVELTIQLVLSQYLERLANFMIATTMALIVGKAVLVANALPFMSKLDDRPMIVTVLYKTIVYWVVVMLARLLEGLIEYWFSGHAHLGGFPHYVYEEFAWGRFVTIQTWILVLFLIFCFLTELDARVEGGLRKLVLGKPTYRRAATHEAAHH